MTGLDYFTFVVLIVLTGAGLAGAVFLASLPGKIAADRGHPQGGRDPCRGVAGSPHDGSVLSIALIWAYTTPQGSREITALRQEVDRRRDRVDGFERETAPTREEGAPSSPRAAWITAYAW